MCIRDRIVTEHGAIDNTPEPGTLHFYDPEDVITYLQMPKKIREIEQEVKRFPDVAVKIAETVAEKVAVEVSKSVANAILHPNVTALEGENLGKEVHGYA